MIERACYLDEAHGAGSMTFLPIVEILEGDLTAFVPTNLVSMTDGQIFLDAGLFGEGQRPALDLGLSVSRVGTKVQWPIIKDLAGPLRLEYLQFREIKRLSKLRSGAQQSEEVTEKLHRGEILTQLLIQDKDSPVPMEGLTLILYAFHKKYLHRLEVPKEVNHFQDIIFEFAEKMDPDFVKLLRERRKMDDEIEKGLNTIIEACVKDIESKRGGQSGQSEGGGEEPILSNIGKNVLDELTAQKTEQPNQGNT